MFGEMILKQYYLMLGIEIMLGVLKHGISKIHGGDNGDILIVHDGLFMVE